MKRSYTISATCSTLILLLFLSVGDAQAQFTGQWLDIGAYHHIYVESGARQEAAAGTAEGMEYPAILRESSHMWAKALWMGVKDWTDDRGESFPYFVARIGPRNPGIEVTSPIQNRLIARYEDTFVEVDGALSFDNVAIIDEVDPGLPADRMVDNIHNMKVGVTTRRRAYAWVNQFHDNYHIIDFEYCNTGNVDDDDDIELDGQTLNDLYFFRIHRWRGNAQGAWATAAAQTWGKFSMIDVVGDGHAEYAVDFTAIYFWPGFDPEVTRFNNLGGPIWDDSHWTVASGDSTGRLASTTMQGRMTLHADAGPNDATYNRCTPGVGEFGCQPHTIAYMDQDEVLTSDGASHQDYYELGILSRENPTRFANGSSRMFPHYADRIEPSGEFWNPSNDASNGKQGGHAPTDAYGPYTLAFGECVRVAVAEGVAGLTYDASVDIGRGYKRGGTNKDARLYAYDANKDGVITEGTFDYSMVGLPHYVGRGCPGCSMERGPEMLTKNQWVMTARDSLFQMFFRARDLFQNSNGLTTYPIPEAPHAPSAFSITGRPDKIELAWTPASGGPSITGWEVYRTERFEDNLDNGCFQNANIECGYSLVQSLPASATSWEDNAANRGTDYYYYLQAVGEAQANDMLAINGTPGGVPLRSSRYLTQAYQPVNLKRPAYGATGTVRDARIVPNPVNLGATQEIRFALEDRVAFFNIPGNCTIKIFSEIGELVHTIEHTDGSGDEFWNLTTKSRQLLVSGIYLAVITDNDTGEEPLILKFVVIR